MPNITVGCKLPNGLILQLNDKTVSLNGFMKGRAIGGYGLTEGVDEAFFNEWIKSHSDMLVVKNELIFKQKNLKEAKSQAKDTADKKSGLEPLDQKDGAGTEKLNDK